MVLAVSRGSHSLLVSQEELDQNLGFELHVVHVGRLVLQHLRRAQRTAGGGFTVRSRCLGQLGGNLPTFLQRFTVAPFWTLSPRNSECRPGSVITLPLTFDGGITYQQFGLQQDLQHLKQDILKDTERERDLSGHLQGLKAL